MSERYERLREARKRFYATGAAAARAQGIVIATYYGHENGSRDPSPEEWRDYARKYKVNVDWLLYDIGPRDRSATHADKMDDLSPDEREEVSAFIDYLKSKRTRRSA